MLRFSGVARRLPPSVVDVAIALAVLAAHSAPFLVTIRVADPVEGYTLAHYLPVLGESLPLIWRRRAPLAVLIVVALSTGGLAMHDPDTAPQPVAYGLLIALYTVAASGTRRERAWGLILLAAGAAFQITGLVLHAPGADTAVRSLTMFVAAWAVGRAMANRQAYVRQLEREKEREAERAAVQERASIARDMHDVLGHAISLMVVQAEAGPLAVRSSPDRAEAAFDAIAAAGRDAMAQVRQLLGLLDRDHRSHPPSIDGIPALTKAVDQAGPRTSMTVSGVPRPLPPDVEVAAYRTVQEALTNVVKHASATTARVHLDWREDELLIGVVDDGKGATDVLDGGHGLAGIQERAWACGGSASFGPGLGRRGFSVSVRLPLAAR